MENFEIIFCPKCFAELPTDTLQKLVNNSEKKFSARSMNVVPAKKIKPIEISCPNCDQNIIIEVEDD